MYTERGLFLGPDDTGSRGRVDSNPGTRIVVYTPEQRVAMALPAVIEPSALLPATRKDMYIAMMANPNAIGVMCDLSRVIGTKQAHEQRTFLEPTEEEMRTKFGHITEGISDVTSMLTGDNPKKPSYPRILAAFQAHKASIGEAAGKTSDSEQLIRIMIQMGSKEAIKPENLELILDLYQFGTTEWSFEINKFRHIIPKKEEISNTHMLLNLRANANLAVVIRNFTEQSLSDEAKIPYATSQEYQAGTVAQMRSLENAIAALDENGTQEQRASVLPLIQRRLKEMRTNFERDMRLREADSHLRGNKYFAHHEGQLDVAQDLTGAERAGITNPWE